MHSRIVGLFVLAAVWASAADWSKPVEIVVDDAICATYRARVDVDGRLVIALTLSNGWHTFAMDNQIRANEKLAGKKALGMDKPTSFAVSGGLAVDGPWMQPELRNFSKPELRIFSWGFEKEALFAAKVKKTGDGSVARIGIKAQACTETICKDINKELELDLKLAPGPAEPGIATLSAVRTQ
jgi:DsbC/DsbD-like thiol-disulfide interchange protein